jgi:hypothetical protein
MSAVKQEPVVTAAAGLATVGGPLGYAATTQTGGWVQVLATVLPVVLPLVVGWVTRRYTSPAQPPAPKAPV